MVKRKMIKVDISFDNTYEEFENIEEEKIYKNGLNIAEYFVNNEIVLKDSVLDGFDFDKVSFDLVFVSDDEIHTINREYREKDRPTDVITFALFADSEPKFVYDREIALGEIVISLDTVDKQAKENGNDFDYELYYIISHGVLHLLGYDHETMEEYENMVELQKKSLKEIYV